ncbi:gluconate:H+ symporter [Cutibacterium avidum]|uniref:GntT/GntP/DsdX family permease n=1 Tax=Cutibacterium avidum TaxID=33010 RepID=UPI0002CCDE01|nr:gluconate:H+ symporter [Cutibacterium avidum]AGJ78034.1 gluconate permease [Cutibacterium avidum 44067]MCO6670462.1 GntP family permease [Cutibacterium avidum]MDK7699589.1 gluconate:H+ symporter [Cutibacterium avidum]MDU5023752.1 gluconate:H+ symporter [Cutibacterium avidum]OIJ78338.1 gluconate transporter [Cutibacterium avidum]
MPVILETTAGAGQLIAAAIIGFALIITLITKFELHPFLSLTIGALTVGAIAQLSLTEMLESYSTGVGSTVASVGVLIALGAIIGKLLADSGGADEIVDTLVSKASAATLPWAMALIGAVIGLPMFFEIGLVLLVPVILLVTRRSKLPLMKVAIPALAGLSTMHALVPPHPGPLAAIGLLKADLGVTLGLGVLIAIPTVVVAGPLFSRLAARWVPVDAPDLFLNSDENGRSGIAPGHPKFSVTLMTVLLPVILMMGKALADILADKSTVVRNILDFLGQPMFALLLTTLLAIFTLGKASGMDKEAISVSIGASLPPIAGILLIVAAGGGFKQILVDTGIAKLLANGITGSSVSPLLMAWLVAVVIRLATGSATVATVTAAGILEPVAATMPSTHAALLVLAIGCGSVFFSHVNDAGFWLIKEYFGISVGENIKSWSLMETVLSVCGLLLVLLVSVII